MLVEHAMRMESKQMTVGDCIVAAPVELLVVLCETCWVDGVDVLS